MKKSKGLLYIRKLKTADKCESIRTAIRMAYHENGYGLFQHGFKYCLDADKTKRSLKNRFLFGWKAAKKAAKKACRQGNCRKD